MHEADGLTVKRRAARLGARRITRMRSFTRQRSHAVTRGHLGTSPERHDPLIEAPAASMGRSCAAGSALRTSLLDRAQAVRVNAPLTFAMSVDGRSVFVREFVLEAPDGTRSDSSGGGRAHRLRIEISAADSGRISFRSVSD
jgi:hypothetical protein